MKITVRNFKHTHAAGFAPAELEVKDVVDTKKKLTAYVGRSPFAWRRGQTVLGRKP